MLTAYVFVGIHISFTLHARGKRRAACAWHPHPATRHTQEANRKLEATRGGATIHGRNGNKFVGHVQNRHATDANTSQGLRTLACVGHKWSYRPKKHTHTQAAPVWLSLALVRRFANFQHKLLKCAPAAEQLFTQIRWYCDGTPTRLSTE